MYSKLLSEAVNSLTASVILDKKQYKSKDDGKSSLDEPTIHFKGKGRTLVYRPDNCKLM